MLNNIFVTFLICTWYEFLILHLTNKIELLYFKGFIAYFLFKHLWVFGDIVDLENLLI